jgi:Exo-beta-D-glucosaminidase Ig-fold domain
MLSENFYWLTASEPLYRQLNTLTPATLSASAASTRQNDEIEVRVELRNSGNVVALADKLTLGKNGNGSRILPAYLSDNYVSLLPGESRVIDIHHPAFEGPSKIALRGWNLSSSTIPVEQAK